MDSGDPLERDRHIFSDDAVWSWIEDIFGTKPRFLRVAELLAFLRPAALSTGLAWTDISAVLSSAAAEAHEVSSAKYIRTEYNPSTD